MSTEKLLTNPNPSFSTLDPEHFQSKASRKLVHGTLTQEQGKETNVIDNVENSDGDSDLLKTQFQPTAYGLSSPPPAD